nr:hypothetical protein [Acinetobacter sp. Marseille-Q1620]
MKIELIAPICTLTLPPREEIPIPQGLSEKINGRICNRTPDDEITQYFIDEDDSSSLKNNEKFIDGYFSIREINDVLYLVATYNLKSELNEIEKKELFEFTSGQCSDGGGESFCCELAENLDFNISNEYEQLAYLT